MRKEARRRQKKGSEESSSATLEPTGGFSVAAADSVEAPDTGATADLACFKWLYPRYSDLRKFGVPRSQPYSARAGFECGNGAMSVARYAANIPVGIAGARDEFTSFLVDAETLGLFGKCALESLGGLSDFPRNSLTFSRFGIEVP